MTTQSSSLLRAGTTLLGTFLKYPRLILYTRWFDYFFVLRHIFLPYEEKENRAAEKKISAFLGVKHTVLVPMGRMAMFHGCEALLDDGDEIIMSPLTVPECVSLTVLSGSRPVFVDVNKDTWCN